MYEMKVNIFQEIFDLCVYFIPLVCWEMKKKNLAGKFPVLKGDDAESFLVTHAL